MNRSALKASLEGDAFTFIIQLQQFLVAQFDHVHLKDQTAQWILNEAINIYPAAGLSLWLYNADARLWILAASAGFDKDLHQQLFHVPSAHEHLNQVRRTRQPVVIENLPHHPYGEFRRWAQTSHINATVSFPLEELPEYSFGVLTVMWEDLSQVDLPVIEQWENVARLLSLAWQWTQLWQSNSVQQVIARSVTAMTQSAYAYVHGNRVEYYNQQFIDLFSMDSSRPNPSVMDLARHMQRLFRDERKVVEMIRRFVDQPEDTFDEIVEVRGVPARYLRWMSSPVRVAGRIQGRICVFNDVTSQWLAEQYHDSFLSLVAHEFRTPVTVIQGLAELLQGVSPSSSSESWTDQIDLIWREAVRLSRLIREIWGASEAPKPAWDRFTEALDFIQVIQSELATAVKLWPDCQWHYAGPGSLLVQMNYEMLLTVLQAVISNAGRFSPPRAAVAIEVESQGNWVILRVLDRGPGISPDIAAALFTQVPDPARRSGQGGMGLGLYVSQAFVRMMGGEIRYDGRPGGGSVFTVKLPQEAPAIMRRTP